jgi:hypothetical protein
MNATELEAGAELDAAIVRARFLDDVCLPPILGIKHSTPSAVIQWAHQSWSYGYDIARISRRLRVSSHRRRRLEGSHPLKKSAPGDDVSARGNPGT